VNVKEASESSRLALVSTNGKRPEAPEAAGPDEITDKVTVHSEERSQALAAAQQAAQTTRTSTLQALAAAVRQGTYKPDPNRIAQQILDDAELIARLQSLIKR
jgi:negative regulator of flagellin synthesis FlgM